MKYPLITKKDKPFYPQDNLCPICKHDRTLNSEFYVINAGALKKGNDHTYVPDEDSKGFLSMAYHPDHHSKKQGKSIEIVSGAKGGQFDLYFCSTTCMRTFFDNLISEFEAQ